MSDNITEVTEDNFDDEVIKSTGPVLVDFGAVWCGPCKMLDPIVDELADDWGTDVKVVKVDVDSSPSVAMSYQVMGVPTLMLFNDGEIKERLTGFRPKQKILDKLTPHLEPA
ncbi:MAG: thioredoxin [Chloroflexota bacterium]